MRNAVLLIAGLMLLAACGDSTSGRALSGGAIGAGVGAIGAAATGHSKTGGALLGGAIGAGTGAATADDD